MKYSIKVLLIFLFTVCLFGISKAQEAEDGDAAPVKITRRPQPGYTDDARREGVEGIVKLKVTFLAEGKIGEVNEIVEENSKELRKTGLVRQAIRAAKKIKFKPAVEDGKPITVTKTVVFTFSLYY